jgi:hypothetical protein
MVWNLVAARLILSDGADAKRTKVVGGNGSGDSSTNVGGEETGCRAAPSGLRIAIRFLAGAPRRAIKRQKRPSVAPSGLVAPAAAYPQPR